MPSYREVGVVLRTYKLGEADRIVVLMTRDRGKVRAVAKGARKMSSRFGARLEPTSHVNVQLYEGRQLDTVTQVELIETFRQIRSDLDRLSRAASLLEVIDQVAQEGEPNRQLFDMLVGGLRAVEHRDTPLVPPAFFLKLLVVEGVGLGVDCCVVCGRTSELVSVDLEDGGTRCRDHRSGFDLSPEAVGLVQMILDGRLAEALALPVTGAVAEVERLASIAVERHIDRRLRALRLLSG